MVLLFFFERGIGRAPHHLVLYSAQGQRLVFMQTFFFLCEYLTVCIDMLIREYRDCLGLLGGLEALGKFGAIRGLVFIDKPLGLWL